MFRLASITDVFLALAPPGASAQASIAGVVKDASGAIVPGLTVEASSPALIEKTRSVVTDGTGQYKIIELKPGTLASVRPSWKISAARMARESGKRS